jgi:hypothetical protein
MARTSSKIVKAIPNTETGIRTNCLDGKYLITNNPIEERFTLWKCLDDGFERIKTSDNPLDFDKIIPWNNKD